VKLQPLSLLLALCFTAAGSRPAQAFAQVAAPSLVEEDLPPTEEPPPQPAAEPSLPPAAVPKDPEKPPVARAAIRSEGPAVRAIEPVRGRYQDLLRAWRERREALREQDVPRAQRMQQRILSLKSELGIESLEDFAAAEVRASARALEARAPGDAVASAEMAVALAPALASGHVALAEARLARDPGRVLAVLKDVALGLAAAAREPPLARSLLGEVLGAVLVAVSCAAALVIALLLLRRLRLALHDFSHLPVIRHTTPLQAGFLGLAVLALPFALRLGPAAILATMALAAAPYLEISERAVATLALVALALLPWGTQQAVQLTAWTGTLAEEVYALEQGAEDGRVAARLEARAARGELPTAALLALGRHHKRRGDLEAALRWYRSAGPTRADALVNMGNVHFLRGDLEGAKSAYLAAIDRAAASADVTVLAAAHYDLSKVFLRQASLEQAQEARKKAALENPALLDRYGSDDDFRANRWLIDVPVPAAEVSRLAADDAPRAVASAVRDALAGPFPRWSWQWGLLAVALSLWPIAVARRRLAPSCSCERCGGPACQRCGTVEGRLCGQCVNVFLRKGVVEARDRLRKEAQVRRHARWRRLAARGLALAGGGGAGHVWRGEAARGALVLLFLAFLVSLAVFWRGWLPTTHPSAWFARSRMALALPLVLVVWALAARDVFSRTRGRR
jgi:tetratricopeptide (TPR) repeat protein